LTLIASTPDLRAAMDAAESLDAILDTLPDPLPSPSLRVALKDIPDQHTGIDWRSLLWPFGSAWRPAMGLTAALALGLVVGINTPPTDVRSAGALGYDNSAIAQDRATSADPVTLAGLSAFGGGVESGFGLTGFSTEGDL
jgi:hypothetical protein